MSVVQIMVIKNLYLVLVDPVYRDSADLHGQQRLEVRIADHKHRVLATHLDLAYTSSTHAADLPWQAVLDDFPGNRYEVICKVEIATLTLRICSNESKTGGSCMVV